MSASTNTDVLIGLNRILGSQSFARAEQLKRLLSYVVLATLEGRSETLKETVIGVEVLQLETNFDPKTDPVVRVAMRRLRARLEQYYGDEGANETVTISLTPGRYVPEFHPRSVRGRRVPIAILPFTTLSTRVADSEQTAIVRHALLARLETTSVLQPVASDFTSHAPEFDWNSRSSQEQLPVRFLVRGACILSTGSIRVSIELFGTEDDQLLWHGEHYQAISDEIWTVQNKIAVELETHVFATLHRKQAAIPPASNEHGVHRLLIQGRYFLSQNNAKSLRKSESCFLAALDKSPNSAMGWAGLSVTQSCMAVYHLVGGSDCWRVARSSADKAIACDSTVSEGYSARGLVESFSEFRPALAARYYELALAANPHDYTARLMNAVTALAPVNRLQEAERQIESVLASDPLNAKALQHLALVLYFQRKYETAADVAMSALDLAPQSALASFTLANAYERLGKEERALRQFRKCEDLLPFLRLIKWSTVVSAAYKGRSKWALPPLLAVSRVVQLSQHGPCAMVADLFIRIGDRERAIFWMKRAFEQRSVRALYLSVDPAFDTIRSDVRCTPLIQHIQASAADSAAKAAAH